MQRRRVLSGALALAASAAAPRFAAALPTSAPSFVAAWDDDAERHHLGVLDASGDALRVVASIELPTRAHGLLIEPGGTVLAAARRPGDWLLRWAPRGGAARWFWSEPDRRFTGHLLRDPTGRWLYSAETDQQSGQGLIAVRDARTLVLRDEWATHGIDPHQFIVDADGSLLVANGGVPTLAETGRVRGEMDRMDASLVRLDSRSGKRLGQWRLADPRLSIRHLARGVSGLVGVALQAEHDDPETKAGAPVLALFDGNALLTAETPQPLAGYGGDIAATASGFVVSAPRAGGVARWNADGRWAGFTAMAEACSLVSSAGRVWAGGRNEAADCGDDDAPRSVKQVALHLDNHWVLAQQR